MGTLLHLAIDHQRRADADAALHRLPALPPACPTHEAAEALTAAGMAVRCAALALLRRDLGQAEAETVEARRTVALALSALQRAGVGL